MRYYLFEKKADGTLHGRMTVIALFDDGERMRVVSCVDLSPNIFREIVLKGEDLVPFSVVYEATLDVPGVNPPNVVEPYVFQVKRV